jgi:hypothetical protein
MFVFALGIYQYTQGRAPSPATLKLPAGAPTVVLKSKGFADYSRTMEMPRSSKLNLRVELKSQSDPRHHRIKLTALRSSTPRDAPGASRTPVQHVIRPLT